ncbi:zona pellucida glycoprotein d [Lampris incognitus]|uniref:zona pellucida glycoprotein d n=1 Tax=Lampris incognitus TaxID=2546036 RepID=UPI0024B592F4|nr:zona pellucida glycoprotein d [Lampris incognitus]
MPRDTTLGSPAQRLLSRRTRTHPTCQPAAVGAIVKGHCNSLGSAVKETGKKNHPFHQAGYGPAYYLASRSFVLSTFHPRPSSALQRAKLGLFLGIVLSFGFHGTLGICSVKSCTNDTRCILSYDQRSCKCARGFYGDLCDKDAKIQVMCSQDYITIMVAEDFFQYYNVPLESIHLPNKSCRAQREVVDGVPYYIARISEAQYLPCGGMPLAKNITHISYSLSLLSAPQTLGNIIRDPVVKIAYTCVYPYVRTVSLPFPVIPFSSETIMHVEELDAKVQMMLYKDQTYAEAYTVAPTIELREKVYVEVKVTEPEDFFLLQVDECWATQDPQPHSTQGLVHTLLLNGCATDDTIAFMDQNAVLGQVGSNGESSTVRYSFDMFRFIAEPHDLYLHCTIRLCEPDDRKLCVPNCKSITKRETASARPSQGLLSYGPIKIDMPDKPHSSILSTVVLPVVSIWVMGFFLIALMTVAKAGKRRLSQMHQH